MNDAVGVAARIENCGHDLSVWNKDTIGNISRLIPCKHKQLKELLSSKDVANRLDDIDECRRHQKDLQDQEEVLWRQRSLRTGLRMGIEIQKKFHSRASSKKRRNMIQEVLDLNGNVLTDPDDVGLAFVDYFSTIFTSSSNPTSVELVDVLSSVSSSLTDIDKASLSQLYIAFEVKSTLDSMFLDKALGPDGMIAIFYKNHWGIVGSVVTEAVLHVLNDGGSIREINDTFITLVPKVSIARSVKFFGQLLFVMLSIN